jgi:hypothetical protein
MYPSLRKLRHFTSIAILPGIEHNAKWPQSFLPVPIKDNQKLLTSYVGYDILIFAIEVPSITLPRPCRGWIYPPGGTMVSGFLVKHGEVA